jgi:hypothetical protein
MFTSFLSKSALYKEQTHPLIRKVPSGRTRTRWAVIFCSWNDGCRLNSTYNIPQDMNIYFVPIEVRVVRSANAFIDSKNTVRLDTDIYIYWVFVGLTLLEASQFKFAFRSKSRDFLKYWTEEESESSIGFLGTISWAKILEEARDIIWCFVKWSSFKRWTSWKSSLVDCVLLCLKINLACGLHISSSDFPIFFRLHEKCHIPATPEPR